MTRHPSLRVVLARREAYRTAILVGLSQADAREYSEQVAARVAREAR